jgi:hypothetical protein
VKKSCLLLVLLALFVVACGEDETSKAPNLALASLTVSSGMLTPAFDPAVTAYTVSVSNTVDQINVTGVAADYNNTVTYEPAQSFALVVGSNLIVVRVTSTDGSLTNVYQVIVHRAALKLTALTTSSGTLMPAFNPEITTYTVEVANTINSITVTGVKRMKTACFI